METEGNNIRIWMRKSWRRLRGDITPRVFQILSGSAVRLPAKSLR